MADSGGFGTAVSEVVGAIVEPVKDEVGQAIETGVQSVLGTTPTPQDPAAKQQREAEEKKKIAEQRWIINKNDQLDKELAAVRQKKAEETQKLEQANQQQDQVQQFQAVQRDQRREAIKRQVQEAKTKSETRRGVGG